jgi:hypothetical protein
LDRIGAAIQTGSQITIAPEAEVEEINISDVTAE